MSTDTPKSSRYRRLTDKISCRQVLNIMSITGFMFNYMLRVNLTIAIVAMAPQNRTKNTSHCATDDNITLTASKYSSYEGTTYDWDAYIQNFILGCFFWGYICTELPGGRLAEVFGAKRIFGYSMLISSVLTLLTPAASAISYIAVIILRTVLGFMLGATWPAFPPLVSKWVPPMERSKFTSNMMASALGAAITMPVCGFLISYFNWESVFYVTGVIGFVWSLLWFYLVFDTPAQHPRISPEEKKLIEDAIGKTSSRGKAPPVPWRQLLTSGPVWAIIITHTCSIFGYFTVVNQLPTYMQYILCFNIKENGLLSSLPYLGKYTFAVLTSHLADYLRRSGRLTTTATRKLFTTLACSVPCILMIIQVYKGNNGTTSVVIFTLALTVNGAITAGYLSNGLDIAPNYSGTIFGLANTMSSLGGYLSTLIVGILTKDNQTYGQWQVVFWILVSLYGTGAITFLTLGSGELQSWNSPKKSIEGQEMEERKKEEEEPLKNGSMNGNNVSSP